MAAKQVVLLCKVALLQCIKPFSTKQNNLFCFVGRYLFMSKPATFIALPISINPRKWYLLYLYMLTNFKIVILSVTFTKRYTTYNLLIFRILRQKVTLCTFLAQKKLARQYQTVSPRLSDAITRVLGFCEAKGEDTDFHIACLDKFLRTGNHCGTSCDDIVDKQQIPPTDHTGILKFED